MKKGEDLFPCSRTAQVLCDPFKDVFVECLEKFSETQNVIAQLFFLEGYAWFRLAHSYQSGPFSSVGRIHCLFSRLMSGIEPRRGRDCQGRKMCKSPFLSGQERGPSLEHVALS